MNEAVRGKTRGRASGSRRAPEPDWWLELARVLGETMGRASATLSPRRPAGPRRSTDALLRELGRLVSEHAEEDYASLGDVPRFWALVSHLHARHREARGRRRARRRNESAGAKAEGRLEAAVSEERTSGDPEPRGAKKPQPADEAQLKDEGTPEPGDAAAPEPRDAAQPEDAATNDVEAGPDGAEEALGEGPPAEGEEDR